MEAGAEPSTSTLVRAPGEDDRTMVLWQRRQGGRLDSWTGLGTCALDCCGAGFVYSGRYRIAGLGTIAGMFDTRSRRAGFLSLAHLLRREEA